MPHIEWIDARSAQLELVPHGTIADDGNVIDAPLALAISDQGDDLILIEGNHEELRALLTRGLALVLRDAERAGFVPVPVPPLAGGTLRYSPDHPSIQALTPEDDQ